MIVIFILNINNFLYFFIVLIEYSKIKFNKYAIISAVLYGVLECLCAIIIASVLLQILDNDKNIKDVKKSIDDTRFLKAMNTVICLLNIKKLDLNIINNLINRKFYYLFTGLIVLIIIFHMLMMRDCDLSANEIIVELDEDLNNSVSSFYKNKVQFWDFVRDNVVYIEYDDAMDIILIGKTVVSLVVFCVLCIYSKKHINIIDILFFGVLLSILWFNFVKSDKPKINTNTRHLFKNIINIFKNRKSDYSSVFIKIYLLILIIYLLTFMKNKTEINFIIISYIVLNCIFFFKICGYTYKSGKLLKSLLEQIPLMSNVKKYELKNCVSIACKNGNVNIDYRNQSVSLLKDFNIRLDSGSIYNIIFDSIGKEEFLNYLLSPAQNNDDVYLINSDNNVYSINNIINAQDFCAVFSRNQIPKKMISDVVVFKNQSEFSFIKLRDLSIIVSALKSNKSFVGLNSDLFSEFSLNEMNVILKYINDNKAKNQTIILTLNSIYANNVQNIKYLGIKNGKIVSIKI